MRHAAVGDVEVVGLCGIFGSQRIDLLDHRQYAGLLAAGAHHHAGLFDVHFVLHAQGACYLEIGKALHLGTAQQVVVKHVDGGALVELLVGEVNFVELLQEPAVNLGEVVYLVDGITRGKGFLDDKDALVGGLTQGGIHVVNLEFLVINEAVHALAYHAQAFLNDFLEGAAYGHNLAHRLHAATEFAVYATELAEVPAGNFADYVVERRFEEGAGGLGHRVLKVEEAVSQT